MYNIQFNNEFGCKNVLKSDSSRPLKMAISLLNYVLNTQNHFSPIFKHGKLHLNHISSSPNKATDEQMHAQQVIQSKMLQIIKQNM